MTARDEAGDKIRYQHHELPDTRRDPDDTRSVEQIAADWQAQIRLENSLAPCGGCPRFVLAGELCECDDELGPFCPACHRDWHEDDRHLGGAA